MIQSKMNMRQIFPKKLQRDDEVRVIAPASSRALVSAETRLIALKRFEALGLRLTFGEHVDEQDEFDSSRLEARLEDFHAAFRDKRVAGIITVLGGQNSNQLLPYIDWRLVKNNPKFFGGFSDITALATAIYGKTGLVTYYGPHYSSFGQKLHFDYTLEYFKKCILCAAPFQVLPSLNWSDDLWFLDQEKRTEVANPGWQILGEGEAKGTLIGGHLGTLILVRGTPYWPKLEKDTILMLENHGGLSLKEFDRQLESVAQMPEFANVAGLVIGRFQNTSQIEPALLAKVIGRQKALSKIPVVANADFGHTDPKFTWPIGGQATLVARAGKVNFIIENH